MTDPDITQLATQIKEETYPMLLNALKATQDKANKNPTAVNIGAFAAAQKALREYEAELTGPGPESGEAGFTTVTAVHAYLVDQGWKCALSTVHNHVNAGKLARGEDERFHRVVVDRYAEVYLQHVVRAKDFSPVQDADEIGDLDIKKKRAETRKADAQAVHWETKTDELTGAVVPRDQLEHELAGRIAIFRSDMENGMRQLAPEVVALCKGDEKLVPEVTEFLLDRAERWLGRYAEDREFEIS